jgi:hypothetical protein
MTPIMDQTTIQIITDSRRQLSPNMESSNLNLHIQPKTHFCPIQDQITQYPPNVRSTTTVSTLLFGPFWGLYDSPFRGATGASADQKITAAMRQLGYGYPADAVAELVSVSDYLASESLIRFCRAGRKKFKPDYLRRPKNDALRETEQHHANLEFPGCIGCVDIVSWTWDKRPVGGIGQYKGK